MSAYRLKYIGVILSLVALFAIVMRISNGVTENEHSTVAEGQAMVMCLSYWEQTANALKNLIDLQCWARTAGISQVVEPSIGFKSGSDVTAFVFSSDRRALRLRELYDIVRWNNMSVESNFSSLASLEDFLDYAVKEVVYVHIKYNARKNCDQLPGMWHSILKREGFRVIKVVCIDYDKAPSHIMTDSSFRDSIFQGIEHSVTVVFNDWHGIRSSGRVALKGSKCIDCLRNILSVEFSSEPSEISYKPVSYIPVDSIPALFSSTKIDSYVNRFLSEYLSGEEYIAVMLRSERIKASELVSNNSCAKGIVSDWKIIMQDKKNMKTLFFSDTGKHGGKTQKQEYSPSTSTIVCSCI